MNKYTDNLTAIKCTTEDQWDELMNMMGKHQSYNIRCPYTNVVVDEEWIGCSDREWVEENGYKPISFETFVSGEEETAKEFNLFHLSH